MIVNGTRHSPMDTGRAEQVGPDNRIPTRVVFLGIVSVTVGLALIAGAIWLLSRGPASIREAQQKLREAGCTLVTERATSARHVFRLDAEIDYNTSPPTNGPHYAIPALWGIYREPVPALRLVHNLEHGGIAIQYGPGVAKPAVERLVDFYFEDRTAVIVAPLPALGARITLGAWVVRTDDRARTARLGEGHLAVCQRFDEDAFAAFRDAYRFNGPEGYPPDSLGPGT